MNKERSNHRYMGALFFLFLANLILPQSGRTACDGFRCGSLPKSRIDTVGGINQNNGWRRRGFSLWTSSDSKNDAHRPLADSPGNNAVLASMMASMVLATCLAVSRPLPAFSYSMIDEDVQGIGAVTQSKLGRSIRGVVIGGAQVADSLDSKWERFSDGLRDEKKCDPRTNRRMFDNGTRRDGTQIGNPVLGALCTPDPLRDFNEEFSAKIARLAEDAIMASSAASGINDRAEINKKLEQVREKVGPAFARAASSTGATTSAGNENIMGQEQLRRAFNRDLYIQMRAYGETISKSKENYRNYEKSWGKEMLTALAPNADRNDYASMFPKPDPTEEQLYDEASLLDALGGVSVVLNRLQDGGLIGHWEISIPEDDNWSVVTVAVDDDVTIGGQILARESNLPLSGSPVVAVVRSAMDKAGIPYKMDTFFIDPTTTKEELYNPTQLLVSLSDLGQ